MTFGESLLDQLERSVAGRFLKPVERWLLPMIANAVKEERKLRAAVVGTRDHTLAFPESESESVLPFPHRFHPAMHASIPMKMSGYQCSDCLQDNEPCPTCYSIYWARRHSAAQKPKETT